MFKVDLVLGWFVNFHKEDLKNFEFLFVFFLHMTRHCVYLFIIHFPEDGSIHIIEYHFIKKSNDSNEDLNGSTMK